MRKTVYTLNVGDYAPEIRALTYPLLRGYAAKIGAEFVELTGRCFPEWPVNYEKFQVFRYAQEHPADWHFFFDADTLIHPETPDWSELLSKDTVAHNGADVAPIRWIHSDPYFRRDGRHIGSCTWCVIWSDWCHDLWQPLRDLTLEQALANIQPRIGEQLAGLDRAHLLDDYLLSRNIARFGLKFTTLLDLQQRLKLDGSDFFRHFYMTPTATKVAELEATLVGWGLARPDPVPWHAYHSDFPVTA